MIVKPIQPKMVFHFESPIFIEIFKIINVGEIKFLF